MINDEQRREVAARIRERLREGKDKYLDALIGNAMSGCVPDGMTFGQTVADLIDRPTATASMDYEAMEDGVPDCRIWTCDRCNGSFPVYRGFIPAYCPNCGAEVVEDD
ncbi:hypothetical protein [Parolsenella catena]|uniref:hypothetical protein n=1 Tax=Parolsenella catena TaxID=2003188 RepID=UPI003AF0A726